jgi:hypothetical protein
MLLRVAIAILIVIFLTAGWIQTSSAPDNPKWCGTVGIERTLYALKLHESRQLSTTQMAEKTNIQQMDDIAVITGNSRTFIPKSLFNLAHKKISFSRNSSGSYDLKVTAGANPVVQGKVIGLGNNDSKQIQFPNGFRFPFYGKIYGSVFVNSYGNLTFTKADKESPTNDLFPVLTGPPRIAALLNSFYLESDEFPSKVRVLQTQNMFSVIWENATELRFKGGFRNTFRIDLDKNGNIDFVFGKMESPQGITGISPGSTGFHNLQMVNYSKTSTIHRLKTAVLQRFSTLEEIDFLALVGEFHRTYQAIFDTVWLFTDFDVNMGGARAYYSHIRNDIRGIGQPTYDYSSYFGSPKLDGFVVMGNVSKFPSDLTTNLDIRTMNTLELLGHENAHRWLSYPHILVDGVKGNDLLGRQLAHWNFYLDTDASVMEGNDIRDNGDGSFTTTAAYEGYSKLDQYLMGFVPSDSVPPFYFVRVRYSPSRFPQAGITFKGTRVNVSVQDMNGLGGSAKKLAEKATYKRHFDN